MPPCFTKPPPRVLLALQGAAPLGTALGPEAGEMWAGKAPMGSPIPEHCRTFLLWQRCLGMTGKSSPGLSSSSCLATASDIPRSCLAGACHAPGKSRKARIIQTFNDTSSLASVLPL